MYKLHAQCSDLLKTGTLVGGNTLRMSFGLMWDTAIASIWRYLRNRTVSFTPSMHEYFKNSGDSSSLST